MGSFRVHKSGGIGLKSWLIGGLSFVAGLSVGIAIGTVGSSKLLEAVGKAARFERLALLPPLFFMTGHRDGSMEAPRAALRSTTHTTAQATSPVTSQANDRREGAGQTGVPSSRVENQAARDEVLARTRLLQQPLRIVRFSSNEAPPEMGLDRTQHLAAVTRDIQRELRRAGCSLQEVDGSWGRESRAAMRTFLRNVNATLPTDQPDIALLSLLRSYDGLACGKGCAEAFTADRDGQCSNLQSASRAVSNGIVTSSTASVQTRETKADDRAHVTAPPEPRWTVMIRHAQAVPLSAQASVPVPAATNRERSSATRMALGAPHVEPRSRSSIQPAALGNDDEPRVAARTAERASGPATRPARPAGRRTASAASEIEKRPRRVSRPYRQPRPSWQERAFAVEH
jgi:hypothetical protein